MQRGIVAWTRDEVAGNHGHWNQPLRVGLGLATNNEATPLSLQYRYAVLLADRTRDVRTVTTVVTEVLAANLETTPLDIEAVLRPSVLGGEQHRSRFRVALGMPAWHVPSPMSVYEERRHLAYSRVQIMLSRRRRLERLQPSGVDFGGSAFCARRQATALRWPDPSEEPPNAGPPFGTIDAAKIVT